MTDLFCFNPLDRFYRSTRGAIKQNTPITFRVKLMRTHLASVSLALIYDKSNKTESISMQWKNLDNGYDVYECSINTAQYKGLVWYYFQAYDYSGNVACYGENSKYNLTSSQIPEAFQLTVFDNNLETPDWYCKGVTYHIFVDRFFRASSCEKLENDPDFYVHTDIEDIPDYLPDLNGEILNRDIYGGNLKGIEEKLDYITSLGVTTLYLSPIFEAWSNHKYNTADYMKIDAHFGSEKDLKSLCEKARTRGIRVILDGVFNHTGSDSIYFNQSQRYSLPGAFRSKNSPYRNWYSFGSTENDYHSWWGIKTLPTVNKDDSTYQDFIMGDNNSVVEHWQNVGISGWRLDVADELPDDFLLKFHEKVRSCNSEAIVIGEVWEDASNKIAYGTRKNYFTESELDGVMNYPLKNAILDFLTNRISSEDFKKMMEILLDHYPEEIQKCLMNVIGTHDTPRVLNALSCPHLSGESRDFKAHFKMDDDTLSRGKQLLKMASCLQYMFPGSPCIYYGDETAMEGFEDPFNRKFYPWKHQDFDMINHYRIIGNIKRSYECMHRGTFKISTAGKGVICILRESEKNAVFCAVNCDLKSCELKLPFAGNWQGIFDTTPFRNVNFKESIIINPMSFNIWVVEKNALPESENNI